MIEWLDSENIQTKEVSENLQKEKIMIENRTEIENLKKEFDRIQESYRGANKNSHRSYGMDWLISVGLSEIQDKAENLGEIQEFILETLYQDIQMNEYVQGFLLDKLYYLATIVQKAAFLIDEMRDQNWELAWTDTDQMLEEFEDYLKRIGLEKDSK